MIIRRNIVYLLRQRYAFGLQSVQGLCSLSGREGKFYIYNEAPGRSWPGRAANQIVPTNTT